MKQIIKIALLTLAAISTCLAATDIQNSSDNNKKIHSYRTNPLELYNEVTSLTMAFNSKYGKKAMISKNAQDSLNLILKNSNIKNYMGSQDYNSYSKNSKFYKRAKAMMNDLENLIKEFKKIGFINEIKSQGKTPALMFDIDNTVELTSFEDDINTKSGINDPATKEFIKKECFKDGIECYFITARTCNKDEALNTKKWLQKNIGLSEKQISKYVFLSGAIPNNACTSNPNNKVAYKDVLRRALSETRDVYWLMSIGDQMTDWFGKYSGIKVWYPNEMFDSSIVENSKGGQKHLQTVTAPSNACYTKLKNYALVDSTIEYCSKFTENKFIEASN